MGFIDTILSIVGLTKSAHNSKIIALITNHINIIDQHINEIAKATKATVEVARQEITFHKNLIKILHKTNIQLQATLDKIECNIQIMRYEYIMLQAVQTWSKKVEEILVYQTQGRIEGKLTPGIISIELLKAIVKQHTSFENTLYTNQPEMLYQHAHVNFVSMTSTLNKFHLTLIYPILRQANLMSLFQVYQVGFKLTKATTCSKYVTTGHKTMKNETFYDIDLGTCTKTPGLTLCDTSQTDPMLKGQAFDLLLNISKICGLSNSVWLLCELLNPFVNLHIQGIDYPSNIQTYQKEGQQFLCNTMLQKGLYIFWDEISFYFLLTIHRGS